MASNLAVNQTVDGASGNTADHSGGVLTWQIWGAFDGQEMVVLEYSPDDGTTWFSTGAIINERTSGKGMNVYIAGSVKVRTNISGTGPSTNINTSKN